MKAVLVYPMKVLCFALAGPLLCCPVALATSATPVTWGAAQTGVPPGLNTLTAVSVALDHTLALRSDGTIVAWGDDTDGQCDVPAGLPSATSVAAGNFFSLALTWNGAVVAWGDNQFGQADVPPNLANVIALSAGRAHSLALRSDGSVVAWGDNSFGQCLVPAGLKATGVLAEWNYSAAVRADGTVVAWGADDAGQTDVPAGLANVVALAGNLEYCLALKSDGTVVGWGNYPTPPLGLSGVVAIAAGEDHALALKADHTVVAWGGNDAGQANVPPGLANVTAIGAAWHYSIALVGTVGMQTVRLTNPRLDANGFSVSLASQSGSTYALQYKDALSAPSWTDLPAATGTGGVLILTDPSARSARRFYRVRQQ